MLDAPPWLVDWLDTVSLWDIVAWLVGAAALVVFIKKGWPALRRFATAFLNFAKMVDAVAGLPAFIARTDTTLRDQDARIAEIHHETHKNDGSSIKDSSDRTENAVERVELGVRGLYDRVDAVDLSLEGLHGRVDGVERQITELHKTDDELRDDFEKTKPKAEVAENIQGES